MYSINILSISHCLFLFVSHTFLYYSHKQSISNMQSPVAVVPVQGGGQVVMVAQVNGSPVNALPFYGEGKKLIEMYGGPTFGCAADPLGCLFGLCCYPCAVGKVAGLGQSKFGASLSARNSMNVKCCFCTSFGMYVCVPFTCGGATCGGDGRTKLELRLGLKHPGNANNGACGDLCCHLCCRPCAVAQELRAVKKYNEMWPTEQAFGSPDICKMER